MKFQKLFWILFNALSQTSCGMDTLKTPGLEECRWHPGVFARKQVTKWHETTKSLTWCRQLDSVPQRDQKLPEVCQVCHREAHEADCTESEDLDEISRPSFCEPRRWAAPFFPTMSYHMSRSPMWNVMVFHGDGWQHPGCPLCPKVTIDL